MIFAIDDGTAAIIVAVITAVTGLIGTYGYRINKQVGQINRAVNNVPEGTPTLVHRVAHVERRQDEHTRWMTDCMIAIGSQLGVSLPDRRDYDDDSHHS